MNQRFVPKVRFVTTGAQERRMPSDLRAMDSLSQIVLGAAVGEAVLGRRIGNRAMIWGAVAGTIPDMDVLGKYFLSELDNLAFHRGISHSLLFSVVGAFVLRGLGAMVDRWGLRLLLAKPGGLRLLWAKTPENQQRFEPTSSTIIKKTSTIIRNH